MSRIVNRVYAIERHEMLSKLAAERLKWLGYDNVEVRTGDGTRGLAGGRPFDAILPAGGPTVPQALKDQLDIGGRLVIPVGDTQREQRLVKVTRTGVISFEEEDLGDVKVRIAHRRARLGRRG